MDLRGVGDKNKNKNKNKNKKKITSYYEDGNSNLPKKKTTPYYEDGNSNPPKRIRPSIPTGSEEGGSVAEGERCFVELLSRIKPLLSHLVQAEVKSAIQTHFHPLFQSLRERKERGEEVIIESEVEKFRLLFCNQPASTIFTNNEIKAENGEPLRVAICDATANTIICTGLLSSAQIEFFVLDGEFGSGQQNQEETLSDFNKSILSPRDGKRPLLVGNDMKLNLENGVALIKNLCITDNSSWMKSKKFRLGVIIRDEKIRAVSHPFRVMDHRGEVNKKHHPPSRDDDVWRLEGIGKDGAYHKNLSSKCIKTVGDFLKAYHEIGPAPLRKLLGNKVPKRTWMMMVSNAFECVLTVPTYEQSTLKANLLLGNKTTAENEAFNESFEKFFEQKNTFGFEIPGSFPGICFDELGYVFGEEDPSPLFPGEASTSYEATTQSLTPNIIKDLGQI